MPLLAPLALAFEKTGSDNLFAKETKGNEMSYKKDLKGILQRFLLIIHFVKSRKTTSLFG